MLEPYSKKNHMPQCKALTKKGTKCKRSCVLKTKFCWQHQFSTSIDEIEKEIELSVDYSKNSLRTINKIKEYLTKLPTPEKGYIYIYKIEKDCGSYYKIGRTKNLPERRVKEWNGILVKSWESNNHKAAETLIHYCLEYCRMIRFRMEDGTYSSFWFQNDEPVADNWYLKWKGETSKTKHIEWFKGERSELKNIIQKIITDLNFL